MSSSEQNLFPDANDRMLLNFCAILNRCNRLAMVMRCLIIISFLFLSCFYVQAEAAAKTDKTHNILILNSYHHGYVWSDDEQQGVIGALRRCRHLRDIYVEYMDTKHYADSVYLRDFKDLLRHKYRSKKLDVVITLDNEALEFILKNRKELFADVPVVFCGVNDYRPAHLRGHDKITGVAQNFDPAGTLDVMLKLHPGTKEIFVINDHTVTGRSFRREIESLARRYENRVKIRYNKDVSFDELMDDIKVLPERQLILLQSYARDKAGRVFDWRQITEQIVRESPVPVYGVHGERLGLGIIGGKLLSGREHGSMAAGLALRILSGEKASAIPVMTKSDARYMFDDSALRRFRISKAALPQGSTIINQPVSFFAVHKKIIIIAAQIIFVLCVVIALLIVNINQRRRAAIAFEVSEKQFRMLADNAPDAIFIQTREQFAYVNDAFCRLVGARSSQEVLGHSVYDLFHPDYHGKVKERIRLLNVELEPVPIMEQKYLKLDKTSVSVEVAAVPFNYQGENGALVFARDVSDRKAAQEALRTSEERFRTIVQNTDAGYFFVELSGKIKDANRAWARMYGYESHEEVIGQNFMTLQKDEDIEQVRIIIRSILRGQKQYLSGMSSRKMRDGRIGYHSYSVRTIEKEGKVVGIEGFIIDTTALKRAEDALAEEKERLLVTLRSIGDGFMTADIDGRIVLMNRVAEDLTGWTNAEAKGLPMGDVFHIVDEYTRRPSENPVQKVLETGHVVGLANHTVLISKDGTERVIADSAAPIRDRDNQIIGIVLVFRDTTAKKRMEDVMRNTEKLEAVGLLAGGIAHDFNNLLGGIYGYLEMIKRDIERGDLGNVSACIAKALATYERAKHITQQLLTFSKGGMPIRKIHQIDRLIRASVSFVLSGSDVKAIFDIPEGSWPCNCDETQITQVIDNMVANARESMPEGGNLEISLARIAPESAPAILLPVHYIRISIRDHGVGIAKEHMSHIFDPFFTTRHKGSGLGLATSYSIVKKHNGHIEAESQSGAGSVFRIYLPEAASDSQKPVAQAEKSGVHKSKGSIL